MFLHMSLFAAQSNCRTPSPSEAPVGNNEQLATNLVVEEEDLLTERMEADGGSGGEATGAEQSDAAPAWEWDDYNVSFISCYFSRLRRPLTIEKKLGRIRGRLLIIFRKYKVVVHALSYLFMPE